MPRYPLFTIFLFCLLLAGASCAPLQPTLQLSPLSEETAKNLQPGLQPRYFTKFMARDVRELPEDADPQLKSWLGEPIAQLNNQFGESEVFGSGLSRGVGMRMRGALFFPTPGPYAFQALSNDGIQMFLGNRLVVSDPVQHSDRLSKQEVSVDIPAAGWYPVQIDYFQRKGTAALQLFWTTPDNATMTIVPADAYGHLP